ncbi:MAG: phosphatase PAP2 family protein [Dysgonomonas sp.]
MINNNSDCPQIDVNQMIAPKPPQPKEPLLPRIVSTVLHPLLMAVYGICLLFIYTDFRFIFAGQFIHFLAPIFLLSCCIPASGIFFLYKIGMIKDLELTDRSERLFPFLIALISYGLLFFYFYKAGLFIWFLAVLAAPLILLIIGAIINLYWKISTHMMGIGGLIGSILSVCYNVKGINPYGLFIILFILAGSLGVSRLLLKRHTPAQVYAGFIIGVVISYLCVWIGANFTYLYFLFLMKF